MSHACPRCGARLERVRRSVVERVLFRKVMACSGCGTRVRERRVPFQALATFVFSRHTRCIECGSSRVRRLPQRDQIDRMATHPLSVLLALTFAPIYHCNPCRLQYHDWRRPDPAAFGEATTREAPVA